MIIGSRKCFVLMAGKGKIGRSPRMLLGGTNGRAGKEDLGEGSDGCQDTALRPRCNELKEAKGFRVNLRKMEGTSTNGVWEFSPGQRNQARFNLSSSTKAYDITCFPNGIRNFHLLQRTT